MWCKRSFLLWNVTCSIIQMFGPSSPKAAVVCDVKRSAVKTSKLVCFNSDSTVVVVRLKSPLIRWCHCSLCRCNEHWLRERRPPAPSTGRHWAACDLPELDLSAADQWEAPGWTRRLAQRLQANLMRTKEMWNKVHKKTILKFKWQPNVGTQFLKHFTVALVLYFQSISLLEDKCDTSELNTKPGIMLSSNWTTFTRQIGIHRLFWLASNSVLNAWMSS